MRGSPQGTLGKGSSLRGWPVIEQASQGIASGYKSESQEHLSNSSLSFGFVSESPGRSRQLDLMILMSPFQLEIYYNSVI